MFSKFCGRTTIRINFFGLRNFSLKIVERKIKIPSNININFVEAGTGKKAVICMPGAIGSAWTDFKPQIEKLPKLLPNYTIIAWDPPGYGKSIPPPRSFKLNFFNEDGEYAHQLMTELGKPTYSILGWSDGGITGMILAGTHPEAVEKLVIWGSNAYITKEEISLLEEMRDVSKWSARMKEPMEKLYGVEGFPKIWSDWVDGVINIYKQKNGDFCKKEVEQIICPTFILHGKKDSMVATEHVPYLRKRIKNIKYFEFSNGKHNIHLRYADDFNKLVAEFLKS